MMTFTVIPDARGLYVLGQVGSAEQGKSIFSKILARLSQTKMNVNAPLQLT